MTDESTELEKELQLLVQRHLDRLSLASGGSLGKEEIEKKYAKLALVSDFAIDTLCQQPEQWHEIDAGNIAPLVLSADDDSLWPQQFRRLR